MAVFSPCFVSSFTLNENFCPSNFPSLISSARPFISFIHPASETCTTVPLSEPPSFFKVNVLVRVYVFPSASPTCISLIHLPSISVGGAAHEAAHRINTGITSFFMYRESPLVGNGMQTQKVRDNVEGFSRL